MQARLEPSTQVGRMGLRCRFDIDWEAFYGMVRLVQRMGGLDGAQDV